MQKIVQLLSFLFLTVFLQAQTTVWDIIDNSDDHLTLSAVLELTGLDEALADDEVSYTVFAPTDDAFEALDPAVLEAVLEDEEVLTAILLYHVALGTALSTDLEDGQIIETVIEENVTVTFENGNVFINDAQVTVADLVADNGVVHVIDAVLLPFQDEAFTVFDIISNSDVHGTLQAVLELTGLDEALSDPDATLTVFAPTDDAFEAIDPAVLEAVLDDEELLTSILLYHVVGSVALSSDLADDMQIETLNGQTITVSITDDGVFINEAQVTIADIEADNGVVHVIDAVLVPEAQAFTVWDIIDNSPDHLTLSAILELTELDEVLANPEVSYTVFAPTDDAFEAIDSATLAIVLEDEELLTAILLYHVALGTTLSTDLEDGQVIETVIEENLVVRFENGNVFINDAQVTVADLVADNGVVHVIDAVLIPFQDEAFTVFDIISNSDDHATLQAVLELAGLDEALSDPDATLTVFAPTDDAFEAIDPEVLEAVLEDEELLEAILLYHVVGSVALSTDLSDGMKIVTLNGQSITVTISDDGVFINDAQVTVADIEADNGVVHVIDAVLIPAQQEAFTVFDIISNSDDHATLQAVLELAGLDEALLDPEATLTVFAPTDDAFEALDPEVLEAVQNDPELLENILLYHVVGSQALSTDLSDGMDIITLNGDPVSVTINDDGVFINDAQVTVADLIADNGVVHVIDAVLTPTVSTKPDIELSMQLSPNPVSSELILSLPAELADQAEVTITDMTGKIMNHQRVNGQREIIMVSHYPQGSYIITITDGRFIAKEVFIKI